MPKLHVLSPDASSVSVEGVEYKIVGGVIDIPDVVLPVLNDLGFQFGDMVKDPEPAPVKDPAPGVDKK